jgi:hypothetical protein
LQASGFDVPEQLRQVALHMGLAHFERQALVERIATGEQVTLAKKALATRNHERDHHPITALHGRHCRAGFFDMPGESDQRSRWKITLLPG